MTGKERRSWHAAGPERADAERLAARLASELEGINDAVRSLSFGAYLTSRWLPGKRLVLAATTSRHARHAGRRGEPTERLANPRPPAKNSTGERRRNTRRIAA